MKNGEERLVVLNCIASSVADQCRGRHPKYVFVCKGQPMAYMLNSAWKTARK